MEAFILLFIGLTASVLILLHLRKEGKIQDVNNNLIPDQIEDKVEEVKEVIVEVKEKTKRVKEELKDVTKAAKKVVKQSSDVVKAAKGSTRKGRKPSTKKSTKGTN
jgi:hypothetical protein